MSGSGSESLAWLSKQLARAPQDAAGESLFQARSYVFGTLIDIRIYGEGTRAPAIAEAVLCDFDRLHWLAHPWKSGEVVDLNAAIARGERDMPVHPEVASLVEHCTKLSEQSDGLFNPALGRLVQLWNFHADRVQPVVPADAEIARIVAARPCMADLSLSGGRVHCRNAMVQLDFGGYAKGYALDRAARYLKREGAGNALINAGGNILALGRRGERPWVVGIRHPRSDGLLATLELGDGEAVSTSGDYERCFVIDGRRYCHVIDPRTGYPVSGTQSVTVLAAPGGNAGAVSDAASGALFVAGPKRWGELSLKLGVRNILAVDDTGRVEASESMARRISKRHAAK